MASLAQGIGTDPMLIAQFWMVVSPGSIREKRQCAAGPSLAAPFSLHAADGCVFTNANRSALACGPK